MSQSPQQKDALCYACALRMSILHQVPPPLPVTQLRSVLCNAAERACGNEKEPLVDEMYHPQFSIIYETYESSSRFLDTIIDAEGGAIGCHQIQSLCCACLGLYQFLDYVYAPSVAAAVRTSPYMDSERISVNVNVHRSISFLWLSMATIFYGVAGRENERPRPSSVIPEEHCNFKEFFMSDFRARVLQYTMFSHQELSERSSTPVGYQTYLREIKRYAEKDTTIPQPRTIQAFSYSPDNEGVIVDVSAEHHRVKNLAGGDQVPIQYCSNRSDGVMTYSVIYDYVEPYLKMTGWWRSDGKDTEITQNKRFNIQGTAILSCTLQHSNIMLIGNYCKMRRDLSQSPWFTDGKRIGTFSLQEIIANPILGFFFPEGVTSVGWKSEMNQSGLQAEKRSKYEKTDAHAKSLNEDKLIPHKMAAQHVFGYGRYKFHSAGREDVDVRMLGTGRPFVLEIISPSRQQVTSQDLADFTEAVNKSEGGSVEISELRLTDADITVRLARHSQSKVKRYRCIVWCSRAILDPNNDKHFQETNKVQDLSIAQRTPIRVLHRRSMQTRPRMIHSIQLTPLNPHWFIMDLETQAGTYVKEFVHGDLGRTTPHLGMLLNGRTDIIQLDVLGMAMENL
ncbi:uncharacterized protein TM35_000161990 [Trypanosoma theileri]|uniref:tRNA pseudouridine(55) synthase n=1 Tax=Trypanosoma theileri TaxID=67003 RepID=A0A1X0NVE2_9TRYP|nr:uncharacterized protein TM35_000161990 [Trypanosoma theileri]ORC88561.1 hypothetical protein TM35_000161990 [Trypanosoma theileri]